MELKRYAIFAGLSVAIHSAAFSASYKPITISPVASTAGKSVSIQFIAPAPAVEQSTAPEVTKENPVSKTETTTKTKAVSTIKPHPKVEPVLAKPVLAQSVPAKSVQPKVKPEKPKAKPVEAPQLKNEPVAQTKTPKKPIKQPAQKPAEEKTNKPEQAEPKQLASQKMLSEPVEQKPESPVTTANATSASPKLITKPTFETRPSAIDYPRSAKRRNIQGVVLVEVWLDPEGDQTKLLIVNSSGHQILDSAALKGISEWQFRQHQNDGRAIAHRVQIPVNFKLN
ncbi:energy transducer TonB [Vibrio lamellibrachiae]|uniref:energy transducer TonB n=1 Tax=Vibrio lamellibrachiae TaxID=2910253 RepID=UPI003D0D3911